jgi:hypothetical protein
MPSQQVSVQVLGQNSTDTDIESASTDVGSDNQADFELGITNISPQDGFNNLITLQSASTGITWASQPNRPTRVLISEV